ncbi:VanZ family protein [Capnocytophaga cynodegmi]|uniref:VanZ family protein n=1 Tax=Capnocytophaga cynodegmi TaxID=28189 RepID=A0A250E8J8_9FLAO|nr:VanZ family protein [Capnocytophaga cynodegmi]ATA68026.1 VanZ family protein [Capnocytophaga cynodegmi]
MLKKRKFTILLGIWFIVVVTLSLMPGDSTPNLPRIPYIDKIAHFTFYFVFTVLFFLTLKNECKCVKKIPYIYIISALFAFLLGISIELLQKTITTTRSGDIYDVFFNSFGTIVALVFVTIINKKAFN